jgi:dimethylhistidine N-methyltransferase
MDLQRNGWTYVFQTRRRWPAALSIAATERNTSDHDVLAATPLHDASFLAVVSGLSCLQKTLPCRWLYDERGSDLFEEITRLKEYYPTRAETAILRDHAQELADFAGDAPVLIEYGAGAGVKTELVLSALTAPRGYVPVEIAEECLAQTAQRIERRFPALRVLPVERDFLGTFEMPTGMPMGRRIGFFPGSTIGNMDAGQAHAFRTQMRRHVVYDGAAIVGVDLRKDVGTLVRAYDDRKGVTAQFNLNLLARINRELGGDFRLDRFGHAARWNESEKAVEMHLVSLADQWVSVGGFEFPFARGETVHTESSRKYDRESFESLALAAGWRVREAWTDRDGLFCVFAVSPPGVTGPRSPKTY